MKTSLTILALAASIVLTAQSSLDKRELLVEKQYSEEIYQVNPIFDYASINVPRKVSSEINNDSLVRISPFTPDLNVSIRPLAYQSNEIAKTHRGFLKADKGTLNPFYAQGGYTYSAPNYFNLTATGGYDKRQENITEDKHIQQFGGQVAVDYYLNKEIKTDVSISYNKRSYGLYSALDERRGEETVYDNIGVALGIQSFKTTPDHWNFRTHFEFDQWSGQEADLTDRSFHTIGQVTYMIDDTWDIAITPEVRALTSDAFGQTESLHGSLQVAYDITRLYAKAGVKLDRFGGQTFLWPDVDIRWKSGHGVDIFLRSNTQTHIWGGKYLSDFNPYTSFTALSDKRPIGFQRGFEAAVKADLPREFDVTFSASFTDASDDPNFIATATDMRRFDVEQIDYQRLSLTVDVSRPFWDDMLSTGLRVKYNRYDVKEGELLNRPLFVASPRITTSLLQDKLTFGIEGLFHSPVTYAVLQEADLTSGWRTQLSAGLSYKVFDRLSMMTSSSGKGMMSLAEIYLAE